MTPHRRLAAHAALVVALSVGSAARADSTQPDDLRARIAELEQTVAELAAAETSLASQVSPADAALAGSSTALADGGAAAGPWIGPEFYTARLRSTGAVAGVELVFLRPYASEEFFSDPSGVQWDFEPSYRVWLGWQGADGLGCRIRYWELDRGEEFDDGAIGVEFRALDLELTQNVDLRRWSLLLSGGIRYAESAANVPESEFSEGDEAADFGFDGIGLTTGLTVARDVAFDGGLRCVATGRWSLLYGNSKAFSGGGLDDVNRDDLVNVLEVQIGPQFRYALSGGALLTLGGGFEAQYWTNPLGIDTEDMGFVGFGGNLGLAR